MKLGLDGKTALVTGASQGVGRETARMLAAEGCNVILVARSSDELCAVRDGIKSKYAVNVDTFSCDISAIGAPASIIAHYPGIDILINNAGAIPAGAIDDLDDARWRTAWDLKVFGYIGLTRCYFPHMAKRGSGVILNVMGASGDRPGPNTIAIGMGNATLNAMTKAIGGVSSRSGVRVVGVNPGPIATERGLRIMRAQAEAKWGDPDRWQDLTKDMPFGRPADPEEIASTILFLVSERASYVSGAVLNVDGGIANKVTDY